MYKINTKRDKNRVKSTLIIGVKYSYQTYSHLTFACPQARNKSYSTKYVRNP